VLRVAGFQAPGCAQELFVVKADRLVLLPESFSHEQGAMVEPTAVGVHSSGRAGDLAGQNVVVLGAGTIGNLLAQVVRSRGAKSVLITDLSDYRLEIARRCGIEHTSNAGREGLDEAARRAFGDEGFRVAFEAAGAEASMAAAIEHIGKGGRIVVVAVFAGKPRIDLSVVGDRELSLIGTLMYQHDDYQRAVELIASGQVVVEPLVTRHFPLEDYAEAYAFIDREADRSLKVVIDVD
jgi:2-desacetyl-2-hydroxyethyl bacteriochlorophyllide A dehydrogenase